MSCHSSTSREVLDHGNLGTVDAQVVRQTEVPVAVLTSVANLQLEASVYKELRYQHDFSTLLNIVSQFLPQAATENQTSVMAGQFKS